jgi:hypothetical protein
MGTVISSELDDTIKQTTQVTLTSLCESRLAATVAMPITLFPICNQGILCGSNALRSCPTLRALTSMLAWLRWPSTCSTHSTCSTT